ncbi:MAG: GntR family transcriptional regulator [Pseudomonas sp.]|nr:GntR family transcriptional regulator [Pseudomonas sp.]
MKDCSDFAYQAVYRYLSRLIEDGQGGSPTRLPSLRHLALRLNVSISTVQSAYCLLEKEGKVRPVPKSGYFAVPRLGGRIPSHSEDLLDTLYANARRPGMFVLGHDQPTVLLSLDNPMIMLERELIRQYPRQTNPPFQPFGEHELRTALAARYTTGAEQCWHADEVYVGADLRGVLKVVLDVLALRGGTVLVESPCSWSILRLLRSFDIRVIEVPLDHSDGLDLNAFTQALETQSIGLAIVASRVSTAQGRLMSAENRKQLAQVLNRSGVWVLENDNQGDLCFEPSTQRLRSWINPARLLVFAAFDKVIGPEAPYGYLLSKHFAVELQQHFLVRSFCLPPIRQKAIARLYTSGRVDQHLSGLRGLLQERLLNLAELMHTHTGDTLRFNLPDGGAGIWAQSTRAVDMRQVFERLLNQRIVIAPGEVFSLQGLHRQHLRISFALDWNQNVAAALQALDQALRQAKL